jgi:hypothetical protein
VAVTFFREQRKSEKKAVRREVAEELRELPEGKRVPGTIFSFAKKYYK